MLFHADFALVVLIAILADAVIGDPDIAWRRWPHPVAWMGGTVAFCDRRMNHETDDIPTRKRQGIIALVAILVFWGALAVSIEWVLRQLPYAPLWIGLLGSVLIAQKSLYDHVARVRDALTGSGLRVARDMIAMVVGRDPESLDEAGIARAAIETTAENFSDGIVAPVFWFLIAGLPGVVLYKVINTADSMIGHRTPRHEAFGWAAARLDDLVNLVPARLAGLFIALGAVAVGRKPVDAFRIMLRDARLHRSPNAGWPEAAMAGGLGIALAGPRRYATRVVEDPFLNPGGRRDIGAADITRALGVMVTACLIQFFVIAVLSVLSA